MKEIDQKIIDGIIRKAEAVCPDSLALIGVYGSAATGDTHEKSDLDLLILINDSRGWQLADAFILDDTGIGYDLYCSSWEMLEEDARCAHAQLSRLLDTVLVYSRDPGAVERLKGLRKKAVDLLASDGRYQRAREAFDQAKAMYADCFLTDSLPRMRVSAGAVIHFVLDAVMLYHGRYFKKGVKRTFEELEPLGLPFDIERSVLGIIRGETAEEIRDGLTELMRSAQACLEFPRERAAPGRDNLSGTYEEMVSNWGSKMKEAAERGDVFSSFMSMVSFQFMLDEIAEAVAVREQQIMGSFDSHRLGKNAEAFDRALEAYLEEYRKAGIQPRRFANVDEFLAQDWRAE